MKNFLPGLRILALTAALNPLSAQAHPGEHETGMLASLAHLLTEPDHLALIAGVACVGVFLVRARMHARHRAQEKRS